jgi:hemerythrin superfamily protein
MADNARTVIDVIIEDHREVEELFQQSASASAADTTELRRVTDLIIAELVRHSVAEELYLYPAFREHLEGGDDLADHEISEHAEAEETMKQLESMDPADAEFRPTLERLVAEIRHHIQGEEEDALPRLAASCPRDRLVELGEQVERAKRIAPTRPHPSAPDTPPLNKVLAPGAGLVDRIRDALTGRTT